ncbi:MAG: tetratricopeptide repeat protein [Flavobacteriaceae bacterium]|jgi:Ca-activated chloride channel homolog|nr:tetratricopeptide repeat protein [Flavobacteriaceae bacterium]
MITMLQNKINKTLINYALLMFISMGSIMSQQNEYESLIKKGNNSFEDNTALSEQNYRKAISYSPEFVKGQYNFSNNLYKNEYYDEALLNQLEASKYAKTRADKHLIFHNIGNILMKKKMCKEAVEAYKNALKNNPKDDESRYNLALAKDCAKDENENEKESEGEDEDEDKEKDKEKDENEDQKEDKDQQGDDEKQNENQDQKENNKDNKDQKGDDKSKDEKPEEKKLSPQQIKNILEAMNQEESKVQEKMNAKKLKGVKLKNEKDW